jgi:hypothetical protein
MLVARASPAGLGASSKVGLLFRDRPLALGVVVRDGRMVEIVTPLRETTRVYRLRCGDLIVDPGTGMHWFR